MLKAIIQKIASWFKTEAKTVEQESIAIGKQIAGDAWMLTKDGILNLIPETPIEGLNMSTPATAPAATAPQGSNVNTAVQIALALKAIDASLSVEAIQAATTAALAAAYPVAA